MTRESLKAVINAWDPMHLIGECIDKDDNIVINDDEYDFEINIICRCITECGDTCTVEKLAEILLVVFSETFNEKSFEKRTDFEQVAEKILHDDSTEGTDIAQVKLVADDADEEHKAFAAKVEARIMARLFDEDVRAEFARRDACLKILEEIYRDRRPKTNLPFSFERLVEIILFRGFSFFPANVERVKEIKQALFSVADTPEKILQLGQKKLEEIILMLRRLTKSKTEDIIEVSKIFVEKYGGKLPDTFDDFLNLPEVNDRTIFWVETVLFKIPEVDLDTHVFRALKRLNLFEGTTRSEAVENLRGIFLPVERRNTLYRLLWLGQEICAEQNPKCAACPLSKSCPSSVAD